MTEHEMDDVTEKIDYDLATAIMVCEVQHGAFRDWIPRWSYDMYKDDAGCIARIIKERATKLRRRKTRSTTPKGSN